MKYKELVALFAEIEKHIDVGETEIASEKLNTAGEEVIKAEASLDRIRDQLWTKQTELAQLRQEIAQKFAQTSASVSPDMLKRSLARYRHRIATLMDDRKALMRKIRLVEHQTKLVKDGWVMGDSDDDGDTDDEVADPMMTPLSPMMKNMVKRSTF